MKLLLTHPKGMTKEELQAQIDQLHKLVDDATELENTIDRVLDSAYNLLDKLHDLLDETEEPPPEPVYHYAVYTGGGDTRMLRHSIHETEKEAWDHLNCHYPDRIRRHILVQPMSIVIHDPTVTLPPRIANDYDSHLIAAYYDGTGVYVYRWTGE